LLHGLAPWLQRPAASEQVQGAELAALARNRIGTAMRGLASAPRSAVPLVDLALLAQALVRAPSALWQPLDDAAQNEIIRRFKHVRTLALPGNPERLFAVMTELALERGGETRDNSRFYEGLRRHQAWDVSNGLQIEGPRFHWESPHALLVQSMLVEALEIVSAAEPTWASLRSKVSARFRAMAELEERLIASDGSFPTFGRAANYRCGIFQGLALAAWRGNLPDGITPSQARAALTAVIRRSLDDPAAYDQLGGLRPPLTREWVRRAAGPWRSELHLCSAAFFPLGLPVNDRFWTEPAGELTWQRAWPSTAASA
jgi:hypothetical protein